MHPAPALGLNGLDLSFAYRRDALIGPALAVWQDPGDMTGEFHDLAGDVLRQPALPFPRPMGRARDPDGAKVRLRQPGFRKCPKVGEVFH